MTSFRQYVPIVAIVCTMFALAGIARSDGNSAAIKKALAEPTELDLVDTPLSDAAAVLKARHNIEIQFDTEALADAGVRTDAPVTGSVSGASLGSGLQLLLGQHKLIYVIRDEGLLITTRTQAEGGSGGR